MGISGCSEDLRPSVYPLAYIRIEIPGCKADLSTSLRRFTRVYSTLEVFILRHFRKPEIVLRTLMFAIPSVYIPVNLVVKLIIQIIVT